jgi:hypothetical protein
MTNTRYILKSMGSNFVQSQTILISKNTKTINTYHIKEVNYTFAAFREKKRGKLWNYIFFSVSNYIC